jgi:hypothetical protein
MEKRMHLGEEHPETLRSMSTLASTYLKQGQLKEAEALQVALTYSHWGNGKICMY